MNESLLEQQAELYRGSAERWKQDHDEAQLCLDLEEGIAMGLHLFERINQRDERNRRLVFAGKLSTQKLAEWEQVASHLLQVFVAVATKTIPIIERCQKKGYDIGGVDRFLEYAREAQGMLTDDDVFFDAETLAPLKDAATSSASHAASNSRSADSTG